MSFWISWKNSNRKRKFLFTLLSFFHSSSYSLHLALSSLSLYLSFQLQILKKMVVVVYGVDLKRTKFHFHKVREKRNDQEEYVSFFFCSVVNLLWRGLLVYCLHVLCPKNHLQFHYLSQNQSSQYELKWFWTLKIHFFSSY